MHVCGKATVAILATYVHGYTKLVCPCTEAISEAVYITYIDE